MTEARGMKSMIIMVTKMFKMIVIAKKIMTIVMIMMTGPVRKMVKLGVNPSAPNTNQSWNCSKQDKTNPPSAGVQPTN